MPRGPRRVSLRDSLPPFPERDAEPRDQRPRRVVRRASPAERRAEIERFFSGEHLVPHAERETPESLRAYLYEDPLIEPPQRAAEGSLRARRQYIPEHERQSRESSDLADSPWNMASNQPSRDLQRRFSREPPPRRSEMLPSFATLTSAAALPPLRYLGSRRGSSNISSPGGSSGRPTRLMRPERLLDRNRAPVEYRPPNPTSFEDLDPLDGTNSPLGALLDYRSNPIMSPLTPLSPSHNMPQHDQAEDNRRVKRRKLDSERPDSGFKVFRYGRFGQVEPGQLKMEIETCDGGVYGNEGENPPESILKNDDSVYCTKRNCCNIVLRHLGSTVFTLTELVIKAPGPRYSSPIREGMVFVSMESDDILTRTAQYQIQFVSNHQISERENHVPIVSVRHYDDGTTTSHARLRRNRIYNTCLDTIEYKTAVFPVDPLPFPVTIATDCSDTEDSTHHPRIRRQPHDMIGVLPFETESSEDGENVMGSWENHRYDDDDDDDDDTPPPNYQRRVQDMTLAEAAEASQLATQEAVQAVGGELLAPHAKFFIERGKNRCTIKFDPPVAGRYILLKMYHPSENIDIQGVYVKGFAGPRFFPCVELR